jgi:hypothetical protein
MVALALSYGNGKKPDSVFRTEIGWMEAITGVVSE